jgi:hypothetical protein
MQESYGKTPNRALRQVIYFVGVRRIGEPHPREPSFMFLNVIDFKGVRAALDFQYGQMGQTFLSVSFLFYLLVF